ncbi:MAG: NitT/TauT family transport system ATP-binding protein [Campylobacterota bacterium]|nr:NitT/TauT family transport system ATP-binding protein [Campylobacterota bacterium]
MARLEVSELNFYFGFTQILNEISFELNKNEIVSIVGPSGGGKTTLLKLCGGLLDVTEGTIANSFKSSAFAFQDARLLPWKTTIENIMLPIVSKYGYKEAYSMACDMALKFGLEEKDFEKYPKDLSGGMRQRVNFARALVTKPELLFLDEPFSALDIGLKRELQDFVLQNSISEGMAVLFITHDIMEAIRLSDRILLLKSDPGEVIKTYEIAQPKSLRDDEFVFEQTRKFLNDKDILEIFEIKAR